MAKPSPQLEAALSQLSAEQGVSGDQVAQLRNALALDAKLFA
ncbi:hypothetical protein GGR70_003065 [Xanthomonas campestris]|nr:hypothetical protein [Xanthomonas campestris]